MNRVITERPFSFRGGGFMYYSKSLGKLISVLTFNIEDDTPSNTHAQKPSFADDNVGEHRWFRGDNNIYSFRSNTHKNLKQDGSIRKASNFMKDSDSVRNISLPQNLFSEGSKPSKESVRIKEVDSVLDGDMTSRHSSNIHIPKYNVTFNVIIYTKIDRI